MMNFGNSPLLDMGTSQQQQPQVLDAELQKMYEAIQQKRASINMQAQQSSTLYGMKLIRLRIILQERKDST